MTARAANKEMLYKSIQAIREKIELMQSYAAGGNLQGYYMMLAELLAINDILNRMGMYGRNGHKLMYTIIMKHGAASRNNKHKGKL